MEVSLPALGVASGHSGRAPPLGVFQLGAIGGARLSCGGPGPWGRWGGRACIGRRGLHAFLGLFLPPPLSVLPKRIVEETSSSNTPNQAGVAPDGITQGPPKSSTTLQSLSQSPKVETVLRRLLVGLLSWGFMVLLASITIL